jgi:predicted SAM-dependent methyltransferase
MRINLGSGFNHVEGYVSCDYDPLCSPDHVVDFEKDNLPFEDSTVEGVLAHHILEHMGEGYFHLLQEIYRVCKHDAIIDIRVPHPRSDAFLADPTHRRPITPMGMKLFSKKFNDMCEEKNFSSSQLGNYYNVNFDVLSWDYIPNEKYRNQFEGMSREKVEEYIDQHSNIVSEIHMKLIVIKEK